VTVGHGKVRKRLVGCKSKLRGKAAPKSEEDTFLDNGSSRIECVCGGMSIDETGEA
jgi:hypothetical protein